MMLQLPLMVSTGFPAREVALQYYISALYPCCIVLASEDSAYPKKDLLSNRNEYDVAVIFFS
jgi:hypothetical protein